MGCTGKMGQPLWTEINHQVLPPSNPPVFPLYRTRYVPESRPFHSHTTRIRWRDWIGDF